MQVKKLSFFDRLFGATHPHSAHFIEARTELAAKRLTRSANRITASGTEDEQHSANRAHDRLVSRESRALGTRRFMEASYRMIRSLRDRVPKSLQRG